MWENDKEFKEYLKKYLNRCGLTKEQWMRKMMSIVSISGPTKRERRLMEWCPYKHDERTGRVRQKTCAEILKGE